MPKVDVIVPTYNRSSLVREAIQSILQQTFADFQIVVVDDGSTDDTRCVVGGISDNRVTYIYKPNGGQATAMNIGLHLHKTAPSLLSFPGYPQNGLLALQ